MGIILNGNTSINGGVSMTGFTPFNSSTTLFQGLTRYYKFEGNTYDEVTMQEGTLVRGGYITGKVNTGLGTNNTRFITNINTTTLGDFSINFWVRYIPNASDNDVEIFQIGAAGGFPLASGNSWNPGSTPYTLFGIPERFPNNAENTTYDFVILLDPGTSTSTNYTTISNPGGWIMISMNYTYNPGGTETLTLYVNTTQVYNTAAFYGTNENIYFGIDDTNVGIDDRNLSFDEIGVWNRKLTVDEISTLYNLGAGLSY